MALNRQPFPTELLGRKEAAAYLDDLGYAVTANTLAVWASERRGPPYRVVAKRAVYLADDLHQWAQQQFAGAPQRPSLEQQEA